MNEMVALSIMLCFRFAINSLTSLDSHFLQLLEQVECKSWLDALFFQPSFHGGWGKVFILFFCICVCMSAQIN